ncbi:hypothetical protein [Planktothrix mougeotii]|uniref:Uncharacterized protein n=1 Tax=Planktothrix mougeotii LEGE 06226 TaxID=1828728 RepID=A0ABR9UJD3_9CYAN|nr:hypothetical protein [Planktothrix mougeotii]MBE9146231.1 hypothetical protein [Planktothrix mougeotii LEGE 06226]
MKSENIKVNPDGSLLLPEPLRSLIKDIQELQVAWNDEFMIINYSRVQKQTSELNLEVKIEQFFNQLDKLLAFNEIEPINVDDIETEIAAYRIEKNSKNKS